MQQHIPSCMEHSRLVRADFREDSGPWPFRGRRIAKATMNMLLDHEGFEEATDVLVIGDSTGGVATMQMIDDLHAQVQPAQA